MVFGRDAACDVVLDGDEISRRHAAILLGPVGYTVTDESANGTLVNDVPIGERALEDGDRITIGETVLEFRRA